MGERCDCCRERPTFMQVVVIIAVLNFLNWAILKFMDSTPASLDRRLTALEAAQKK